MSCPEIDQLEQLASGTLDESAKTEIEEHLGTCAECSSLWEDVVENLKFADPVRGALGDSAPTEIGAYRIIREIGRGGMGIVYEAQQRQTERTVALKVIRSGHTAPSALRRFEHEARFLARLQHPGIAQIFEAGTARTDLGTQPYFAMEFVRGRALRNYADTARLDSRQRLEIMASVCDAVHHAHQKGVIHRDLKPSNILVDEHAQPKVLDFGVARATDADLRATTLQTNMGQLVGTVPYMSPEQVSGDPAEMDTRSDVYALGVVTYELLSGALPYQFKNQMIPEAVRAIREDDPTPLSSIDAAFRGDVETIVAKALEREKARRYQSAAEFATDIRRYLRDEPVSARPPSAIYQARKFARRNKALVGAAAVVFVAFAAAAAVSTWQAIRATRAQARAEANEAEAVEQAAKFEAVNGFLEKMLESGSPEVSPEGKDLSLADVLDRSVAELDAGSLKDHPEIEAVVRTTIGNTHRALGNLSAAETQLRIAVRIARSIYPEGHEDLAFGLNKLARVLHGLGDLDESEAVFRESLAMRQRLLGEEHEDVATSLNNLGWLCHIRGKYSEATTLLRQALDMRRRLLGSSHVDIANSLNNLAATISAKGKLDEAEAMFRESLAMDRKLRGELHPNVPTTMINLALTLMNKGRLDEAEALMRDAVVLRRRIVGDRHPEFATGLNNLATVLRAKGEVAEAEELFRQSLAIDRAVSGRHPKVATTLSNLAALLNQRGEPEEAGELYREALEIRLERLGDAHPHTLYSRHVLGSHYLGLSQYEKAERHLAAAVDSAQEFLPAEHRVTGLILLDYGKCLNHLARYDEAEPRLMDAHRILAASFGEDHRQTMAAAEALINLYEAWGKPTEADRLRMATASGE